MDNDSSSDISYPSEIEFIKKIYSSGHGIVSKVCKDDKPYICKTYRYNDINYINEMCFFKSINHPNIMHAEEIVYENLNLDNIKNVRTHLLEEELFCLRGWRKGIKVIDIDIFNSRVIDMIRAVHFLHANAITHNDIKLSNFLINPSECFHEWISSSDKFRNENNPGTILLTDFSISFMGVKSIKGEYSCTLTHRPIECFTVNGKQGYATNKADVWALGCTLFELVYGMYLFLPQSKDELPKYYNSLCEWAYHYNEEVENIDNLEKYKKYRTAYRSPNFPCYFWRSKRFLPKLIIDLLHPDEHKRLNIFEICRKYSDELKYSEWFSNDLNIKIENPDYYFKRRDNEKIEKLVEESVEYGSKYKEFKDFIKNIINFIDFPENISCSDVIIPFEYIFKRLIGEIIEVRSPITRYYIFYYMKQLDFKLLYFIYLAVGNYVDYIRERYLDKN